MFSTSLKHRAADGRRGGAGRRQVRVQGLGVLGGSRGPHVEWLLGPGACEGKWGRVWYEFLQLSTRDSECLEGVAEWEGSWKQKQESEQWGWWRLAHSLVITAVLSNGGLLCGRRPEACTAEGEWCVCVWWEDPASFVDHADCYKLPVSARTDHLHDDVHKRKNTDWQKKDK